MGRAKSKAKKKQSSNQLSKAGAQKLPFIEHVYELRKRLFYVSISVALFSGIAYGVEHHLVSALLKPAHGQKFIYTSPGGGIDFLFRVCLYVGIACSIPVIVYQVLRYVQPLIKKDATRFIAIGSVISGMLALAGMAFGYFIGLPAALHFLLHQFVTNDIQALLTIQSYMSFVTMYMLGSAMLFQMPLILLFINRIKPLKPGQMLRFERWVILLAFIGGGIMNPSPNIADQLLLAGPMILMYQLGIVLVWIVNRKHAKPKQVAELLRQDAEVQAARREQFQTALVPVRQPVALQPAQAMATVATRVQPAVVAPAAAQSSTLKSVTTRAPARPPRSHTTAARPRRYINDFTPRPTYTPLHRFPNAENAT